MGEIKYCLNLVEVIQIGSDSGVGYRGHSSSSGEINRLQDVARRELDKENQPERRRVFLSFKYEDKTLVEFLRAQAKNENSELDFIDMSLQVPFNSENAEYIKQGIRARINQSSVTLVMASKTTHESEWVNWEIEESIRLGKRVVVVNTNKEGSIQMPNAVEQYRDKVEVVGWKHQDMMDAINRAAKN